MAISTCTKNFSIEVSATSGNTACNLNTAGAGDLGNVTNPTVPGVVLKSWGVQVPGNYTITYVDGAMFSADNPCPNFGIGEYKFSQQLYAVYNGGSNSIQWINGNLICDLVESVVVTASKLVRTTFDFDHNGGYIAIADDFGPATLGASATIFQLTQNCVFPTMPTQIRIASYNALLFTSCLGEAASGLGAWSGTLPIDNSNFDCATLSQIYNWTSGGSFSINGQLMSFAQVDFINDGSAPTTTGCGWMLQIFLSTQDLWLGWKGTGSDPTGEYVLASGCSPGPSTLTIESY